VVATAPLAVVRFHGRNEDSWRKPGISAAERFAYDYPEAELVEWVPRIRDLGERADSIHLMFNNCYSDYGVRNAADLARLLT
jgi:uncharacterized protein YecE (DUF72 family)